MQFDDPQHHNVTEAIIYCRVSSKAQTKRGDGLNSQQTRCREYARYKGYNVNEVFTDDLTGRSLDRPGLTSLLGYLKADRKNPHVVIIDDLSRMARRVAVHFELRQTIAEAGGILESPSVELRNDADGELHEYILASVSQHQSRKNAEQTVNRMRARTMNGYWVFQAPIGYKYQKIAGHGKLLVRNEPVASIIQEGLEGYASGRFDGQSDVRCFFESQPDFPKDLPNDKVRHQRVTHILTRVLYAGFVEAPNWDIGLVEGKHDGLIDLATHQKILERIKDGAMAPRRKDITEDFPLRGFVLCGDCNKPLTACWSKGGSGKKHPYYLCFNTECVSRRKSIPKHKIEGEFEELLQSLKPSEGMVTMARDMFKHAWDMRLDQAKDAKEKIAKEIFVTDKQIEKLVDRIVDADNPTVIAAYEKRINKLERDKLVLAEKALKSTKPHRTFEEMFERAMTFLSNPCNLWASDNLADQRTALKLAFASKLAYHREDGFRTPQVSVPFEFLGGFVEKSKMARPKGFEPLTPRFVV